MNIFQVPEPFSPAFQDIFYKISLDENEQNAEISIFNSPLTQKIGIKKGTEFPIFTLNAADYLRSQVAIKPIAPQNSGIILTPERVFQSCIAFGSSTFTTPHTAGIEKIEVNGLMSDARERRIGPDEQDEIPLLVDAGNLTARIIFNDKQGDCMEIGLGSLDFSSKHLATIVINTGNLLEIMETQGKNWEDFISMAVPIYNKGVLICEIRYRMMPHNCNKTRLCWWNRYGAIDYYTFETAGPTEESITREQIDYNGRSRQTLGTSHKTGSVTTTSTTKEQAEWLAGCATSPQVWIADGANFIPIEITDDRLMIHDKNATALTLHYRHSDPIRYQTL